MTQFQRILLISGLIATALAAAVGQWAGHEQAHADIEKLELVWPDVLRLPQDDRALLAGLAMSCRLARKPADRKDVIECLREAMDSPEPLLPKGVSRDAASMRLDALLAQAR